MYPYGFPFPFTVPNGNQDEAIRLAKAILKEHKAEKKKKIEDEKKKEAKSKARSFSFFELTGAIFLFSIPTVMLQMLFISWCQTTMNNLINAAH